MQGLRTVVTLEASLIRAMHVARQHQRRQAAELRRDRGVVYEHHIDPSRHHPREPPRQGAYGPFLLVLAA